MYLSAEELKTNMYAHVIKEITESDDSIVEQAIDDAPDALEGAIWMLSNKVRTSTTRYVVGARPNRKYW